MVGDRHAPCDRRAEAGSARDLELAADRGEAVGHPLHPRAERGRRGVEPASIVADLDVPTVCFTPKAHHGLGGGGVLAHIGQRLLADAQQLHLGGWREVLLGRFDSVTGQSPEIDLTKEDQSRNISRRHARLVIKEGKFFIAEEIGTMNGTFLNGKKLPTGVLTPIKDGDEITLCRLVLNFKTPR